MIFLSFIKASDSTFPLPLLDKKLYSFYAPLHPPLRKKVLQSPLWNWKDSRKNDWWFRKFCNLKLGRLGFKKYLIQERKRKALPEKIQERKTDGNWKNFVDKKACFNVVCFIRIMRWKKKSRITGLMLTKSWSYILRVFTYCVNRSDEKFCLWRNIVLYIFLFSWSSYKRIRLSYFFTKTRTINFHSEGEKEEGPILMKNFFFHTSLSLIKIIDSGQGFFTVTYIPQKLFNFSWICYSKYP